jgi:hypothetical protein
MKLAHLFLALLLAAGAAARPHAASASGDGGPAALPDTARGAAATDSKESIKREMARIGQAEVPGEREWQRRKSPTVAVVSSMMLPGLGQLYNGRRIKTVIAVGVFSYYLGRAWLEQKDSQRWLSERDSFDANTAEWREADVWYQFYKESAKDFLWWSGAVWLICALDAFVDAHLYDVRSVKPELAVEKDGARYVGFSVSF